MMRRWTLLLTTLVVTVAAVAGGCAPDTPTFAAVQIGPTPVKFRVEVAQTAEQQRDGLSGRSELAAGTGMLFRFGGGRNVHQVWMAGMTIPLDIAWIADGKVVATDTLTACTETDQNSCPKWTSPSPVDALLEVPENSLATVIPGMNVTIDETR